MEWSVEIPYTNTNNNKKINNKVPPPSQKMAKVYHKKETYFIKLKQKSKKTKKVNVINKNPAS